TWTDLTIADVSPAIAIRPRGYVDLTDDGGVKVTGDFEAGDMMTLTLSFSTGQSTTMEVPVVFACDEFTDLDTSTDDASASDDASDDAS
ncbi:MAG TPA: hypothetical protein DEQ43_21780, partial [Nocardioides bacterium]|nr:hypothetical protein [Nocardioides sp.]